MGLGGTLAARREERRTGLCYTLYGWFAIRLRRFAQQLGGEMATGQVKWFKDAEGFGYIKPDDSDEHLFFRCTAIVATALPTLTEGQRVEFDVEEGPKGLQAVNVRPID
jgi:CspA family cold shock protein